MPKELAFESPPEVPISLKSGGIHPYWDFWFKQLLLLFFGHNGFLVTHDPASIGPGVSAQQVIAVVGIQTNTTINVNKPTKTAGITLTDVHASASNELTFTLTNNTGGSINPGEEIYRVVQTRM